MLSTTAPRLRANLPGQTSLTLTPGYPLVRTIQTSDVFGPGQSRVFTASSPWAAIPRLRWWPCAAPPRSSNGGMTCIGT
jgi:hypothetical protein